MMPNPNSDALSFDIQGIRASIENLKDLNAINSKNKEDFLNYISNDLAPTWTTKEGVVAVEELREFVNIKFEEYIRYLNSKINSLENVVVPALNSIDNA